MISELPKVVRTNDLEHKFLDFASQLGIHIQLANITSVEELTRKFPNTKLIVGSDGSHSVLQQEIFNGELAIHESLQYIVDIKYEVFGEGKKLNFVDQAYPTLKIMHHVAEEHIGKVKEGKTPITLRLLINKKTYENVKGASFKSPYFIPTHADKIGKEMLESITIWMNAKSLLVGEKRVPGSEKISALNLSVYRSSKVALTKGDTCYFLVGDSAFGVPFFRALNNGLLCGTKLASTLNLILFEKNVMDIRTIEKYSEVVIALARMEIRKAKNKESMLQLAQIATKVC